MKDISFFSEGMYLNIPNSKDPKVVIAIGGKSMAENSFKIYNPFSKKAKLFKSIVQFFCVNFNTLFLKLIELEKHENSAFITFLNLKFQKKFTASIYNATLKDKIVIQLQSNGVVFGYVKFPLNEMGLKNIKNEISAIELLSKKGILNLNMESLQFKGTPFFILPELKGNITNIPDKDILKLLESYKKDISLKLDEHSRIVEMKDFFIKKNLNKELRILENILENSKEYYHEVYEHGDFAPWNIVSTKNGLAAFDFEYFKEKGLEHFDLIKYHFQVGRLLKGKNQKDLYEYIFQKTAINEVKELLSLFLLKEIMSAFQQEKKPHFEEQMLNFINE